MIRVCPTAGSSPGADIGHRLGVSGGLAGCSRRLQTIVISLLGLHGSSEGVKVEVEIVVCVQLLAHSVGGWVD